MNESADDLHLLYTGPPNVVVNATPGVALVRHPLSSNHIWEIEQGGRGR